jgi:two-component system sensor histidine kinase YesM
MHKAPVRLEQAVNEVERGNLDASFDIKGTYETEMFAASLGSMVNTVKQLMGQVVEDQEVIRTSELRALQAQINPHFLYNTLDSIVWIAEDSSNEKIKEITMALANYFKIVLSSGKDIISVHDEIEHIKNYLVIQKMRYENMDYEIEIDSAILGMSIPKLLLQPIVENAIYHGIKYNDDGGTIWIRGGVRQGALVFEVEDNGRGCAQTSSDRYSSRQKR